MIGPQWVGRPANTKFHPKYTIEMISHRGESITVDRCFLHQGMSPLFWFIEMMTAGMYENIHNKVMLSSGKNDMPLRFLFQQDNEPNHRKMCQDVV